jgi:antitoxin YokJ
MVEQLVQRMANFHGCTVYPAAGQPRTPLPLPEDLQSFYALCGGALLFKDSTFPLSISTPAEFIRTNELVVGSFGGDDPSDTWYVVAKSGGEQLVSIDLDANKLGRCYDSFWDRHAVVGSCPVIALSFTDFLQKALEPGGSELYWLGGNFKALGDAYD